MTASENTAFCVVFNPDILPRRGRQLLLVSRFRKSESFPELGSDVLALPVPEAFRRAPLAYLAITWSVAVACLTVFAQESVRGWGGGVAERFRQLDRDHDGRVTDEDARQMPVFDQWDANQDGAVAMEEVASFYASRRTDGGRSTAPLRPDQ